MHCVQLLPIKLQDKQGDKQEEQLPCASKYWLELHPRHCEPVRQYRQLDGQETHNPFCGQKPREQREQLRELVHLAQF